MQKTISAPTTKILYKIMASYHLDSESIYKAAGIKKRDLNNINMRLSYATLHDLWEQATHLIDDPCFGLKGVEIWHPSDLDALGYSWLTSSTLRSALDRLRRFIKMATEFYTLELLESATGYEIIFDFADKKTLNAAQADASIAIVMEMCRLNLNQQIIPVSVSLTHPKPDCHQAYSSYYDCPVAFSQAQNKIVLPLEIIDEPLFNSAPSLTLINDKAIIDYLQQLDNKDIVHRIKKAITEQLSSGITSAAIASSLNMGERTMQRQLKEQGYLFKELVKDVQYELSKLYIKNNQYSITEIAFQLGFSESSSFSRAFKRWSGCSPADYR